MNGFISFLVDNYLIFLLIVLVLIFALIGYLVDSNKEKNNLPTPENDELDLEPAVNVEVKPVEKSNEPEEVEELFKTLKDIPLGEAVQHEEISSGELGEIISIPKATDSSDE